MESFELSLLSGEMYVVDCYLKKGRVVVEVLNESSGRSHKIFYENEFVD